MESWKQKVVNYEYIIEWLFSWLHIWFDSVIAFHMYINCFQTEGERKIVSILQELRNLQ